MCLCIGVSVTLARNHTTVPKGFPGREQLPGGWPRTSSGSSSQVPAGYPETAVQQPGAGCQAAGGRGRQQHGAESCRHRPCLPGQLRDPLLGRGGMVPPFILDAHIHLNHAKSTRTLFETSPSLLQSRFSWRELPSVSLPPNWQRRVCSW